VARLAWKSTAFHPCFSYKHFYSGGQGKEGQEGDGSRKTGWRTRGRERITGQAKRFLMGRSPVMCCLPRVSGSRAQQLLRRAHLNLTTYGPALGIVDLMESVGRGEGRIARFERVFRPAAIALAMAQDAVDDAGVGNKRDEAHWGAAGAASQRVSLSPGTQFPLFCGSVQLLFARSECTSPAANAGKQLGLSR